MAETADFIRIGTMSLMQLSFDFSRDDLDEMINPAADAFADMSGVFWCRPLTLFRLLFKV